MTERDKGHKGRRDPQALLSFIPISHMSLDIGGRQRDAVTEFPVLLRSGSAKGHPGGRDRRDTEHL